MGLNDSFSTARGQILMMNPLPTIAQAFSLIKQEERQRQGSAILPSFLGTVKNEQPVGKSYVGHNQSDGTNSIGKKSSLKCNYCHKKGHLKESCFKLIGYPPKGRGRGKFNSGNTSIPGSRMFPHAMQVTAATVPTKDSSSSGSQSQLGQLQQQVFQMASYMSLMMNSVGPGVLQKGG